mmetsp:Transcript_25525/g.61786  ORF Transcript_25525/g.61786 Transcript_25525/m.61786 type:complete len:499 (-) Transcript_25525:65-1561(-)
MVSLGDVSPISGGAVRSRVRLSNSCCGLGFDTPTPQSKRSHLWSGLPSLRLVPCPRRAAPYRSFRHESPGACEASIGSGLLARLHALSTVPGPLFSGEMLGCSSPHSETSRPTADTDGPTPAAARKAQVDRRDVENMFRVSRGSATLASDSCELVMVRATPPQYAGLSSPALPGGSGVMDLSQYVEMLSSPMSPVGYNVPARPSAARDDLMDRLSQMQRWPRAGYRQARSTRLAEVVQRAENGPPGESPMYLTDDEAALADSLLADGPPSEVVSTAFKTMKASRSDLWTLRNGKWLNDEVMNFFMKILQHRSDTMISKERNRRRVPRCWFTNTFFWAKLSGTEEGGSGQFNYKAVARWAKKAVGDVFVLDAIVVPVHLSLTHWALGVVDMRHKRFLFLDSLNGTCLAFPKYMMEYLRLEHEDKKKSPLPDQDEWTTELVTVQDVPRQRNSYDCGVFTLMFAECWSDSRHFDFDQDGMPEYRKKIAVQIRWAALEDPNQ